jgi:hypothetical protein
MRCGPDRRVGPHDPVGSLLELRHPTAAPVRCPSGPGPAREGCSLGAPLEPSERHLKARVGLTEPLPHLIPRENQIQCRPQLGGGLPRIWRERKLLIINR